MSERVTIGNYQLQLKRTTSALAKNYGKQNLWREIKNIRNADADSIVIGADLRQVAWLNSTATTMADEILSYWNAMDSYIQRQQQQNDSNNNNSNNHNNNSNNHNNNNSTVMVSIEELDDTTITSVNDNNNQESQEIESETGPVIPPNVPVEYVGWDSTKNYIIYGDGTILYDCRTALNQSHDAAQRDKFYHSHKRYVVNQFRNMCEKSRALSILYTINKERLGLPGSVATVMFSPLFYHPKHVEIRLMLSNAMNLGVSQIEERSRLENDINIDNNDLLLFMKIFREKIESDAPILLQFYETSLCKLLKKSNMAEVSELFSNILPEPAVPTQPEAPEIDSENDRKDDGDA